MPYANLPGVDLWYEDSGDGVPVVFCHAASGTCDCWIYQLPAFTLAGYRCITYDRRTWGKSRNTDETRQPGYQDEDLHGLVEFLGLDRFHLVGTAAGGITAIGYALAHPERVRSLVFANTIAGIQDPEYLEVQDRIRPPEIRSLPVELYELGPSYRGTDPDGTARWLEIERASRPYGRLPGPATARAHHLRPAGHHERADDGASRRGRPGVPAGADAVAGRAHPRQPLRVAAGGGPRRFLGTPAGVERAGAGVHWAALGDGSSNGSLKCEKRTSIEYWCANASPTAGNEPSIV